MEFKNRTEKLHYFRNEIMSSGEVLAELGVSRSRLKELIDLARLEPIKSMGSQRIFLREDVLELKAELEARR